MVKGRCHLNGGRWEELSNKLDNAYSANLLFQLPKLNLQYTHKMIPVLKEIGVNRVFSPNAELGRMVKTTEPFWIHDAAQNVFLRITEKGTVAGASFVMSGGMKATSAAPPPKPFAIDHPFLIAIQAKRTHTILFLAAIHEPEGGEIIAP